MRLFFRNLIASIAATRYLVSWMLIGIALLYGILTLFSYVPLYTDLAIQLNISIPVFFGLLYGAVFVLVVTIWYLWVIRPEMFITAPSFGHTIYTQTDRTGLVWLNLLILALIAGITYWVRNGFVNAYLIDATVFFAIVIAAPLCLDLLPFTRPRRAVVPLAGQTLLEVATTLAPDPTARQDLLGALYAYNRLNLLLPDYIDPNADLPDGLVLFIPPGT